MAIGYFIVALLAAAIAVFALQNGTPVGVRFLIWSVQNVPIAGLALGSLAVGLIVAGLPLTLSRWRLRSRARALENQIKQLQAALEERDRALLAQRPRPLPETP
jgi:uncharacterized integral membrane protein